MRGGEGGVASVLEPADVVVAIQFVSDLLVAQLLGRSDDLLCAQLVDGLVVQAVDALVDALLVLDRPVAVQLVLEVAVLVVVQPVRDQLVDRQLGRDGDAVAVIEHVAQRDAQQCGRNGADDARLLRHRRRNQQLRLRERRSEHCEDYCDLKQCR